MSRHHLSHAEELYWGPARTNGAFGGKYGVPFHPITKIGIDAPAAVDGDGIAAGQTLTDGEATPINTTLDVARNVTITPSGDDSGITYTVAGRDQYGAKVTEQLAGANATKTSGAKAFKVVDSVTANGAPAGTVDIGWGREFGLGFVVDPVDVVAQRSSDGDDAGTLTAADENTASATTGDVRGTYNPGTAPDGALNYSVWAYIDPANAYGVEQA